MYCSLLKLIISNAMDSDRPIPRFAARHLARCDSCREFAEMAGVLEEKLVEDARGPGITLGSLVPESVTVPARPLVCRPAFALVVSCVLVLVAVLAAIYTGPRETETSNNTAAIELWVPSIGDTNPLKAIDGVFAQELATLGDDAYAAVSYVANIFPVGLGQQAKGNG